jgi:hypothetical protein
MMAMPKEIGNNLELRRTMDGQRAPLFTGMTTFVINPTPANQSDYKLSGTPVGAGKKVVSPPSISVNVRNKEKTLISSETGYQVASSHPSKSTHANPAENTARRLLLHIAAKFAHHHCNEGNRPSRLAKMLNLIVSRPAEPTKEARSSR